MTREEALSLLRDYLNAATRCISISMSNTISEEEEKKIKDNFENLNDKIIQLLMASSRSE